MEKEVEEPKLSKEEFNLRMSYRLYTGNQNADTSEEAFAFDMQEDVNLDDYESVGTEEFLPTNEDTDDEEEIEKTPHNSTLNKHGMTPPPLPKRTTVEEDEPKIEKETVPPPIPPKKATQKDMKIVAELDGEISDDSSVKKKEQPKSPGEMKETMNPRYKPKAGSKEVNVEGTGKEEEKPIKTKLSNFEDIKGRLTKPRKKGKAKDSNTRDEDHDTTETDVPRRKISTGTFPFFSKKKSTKKTKIPENTSHVPEITHLYKEDELESFEFRNPDVKEVDDEELETANFHEMKNYGLVGSNVLDVTKGRVKAVIQKQKTIGEDEQSDEQTLTTTGAEEA